MRRASTAALVALLLAWPARSVAQVAVPEAGHGSVTTSVQQVLVTQRTDDRGRAEDLGHVSYRTLRVDLDYGFADRWAVSLGIPYGSNRYRGDDPHDPRIFQDPHGQHFIDDGRYRDGLKDWQIGVRYQWLLEPVALTPYLRYHTPSHRYDYYGESALGLHQTELEAGLAFAARVPPATANVYVSGSWSYSWMGKEGERRVNHSTREIAIGRYCTPSLALEVGLANRKSYHGLDYPAAIFNADGSLNEDRLFHHDTLRRIDYTEGRIGLRWQVADRLVFALDAGRTLHGDNVNLVHGAYSAGLTWSY
jgi:hypothetical protein